MKLLDKSFKPFAFMTIILVLISIPLFYFVVVYIYTVDADQSLKNNKLRIEDQLNHLYPQSKTAVLRIRLLNELDIGYKIISMDTFPAERGDRFYTAERFDQYSNSIRPYRYLETVIDIFDNEYLLKAEVDMEEYFDVIPYTTAVAGLFFFFILVGYYFINRFIAGRVWQPFYKTLDRLSRLQIHKGDALVPVDTDIEEFQQMNENLLFFTNRSQSAYNQQKEFTENASHELQTPLAVLQAKSDLLMQSDLSEAQYALLDQINLTIGRMNRLNKNLLLLTKIENKQFIPNERINLSDTIKETIDLYMVSFKERNLEVVDQVTPNITIQGNRALIETLINSLLTNSISHNIDGGSVIILLNEKNLIIKNTGISNDLGEDKIFKRFNKGAKNTDGSGLGLAICEEICNMHQMKITYRYFDQLHSFRISNIVKIS
ncbi:HAMP domain-containing histidine kinase [Belliella sp. R4-6]|uniref:histidine kinase n=1 Tax=Belliella alkalica TaxID=1730871 RepID=A0ABS9VCR5_9BACT|nr:HAMP domain-containing sensor histidine kinase [Belliella alkalica]MCH7413835.1 HAMP domain-containing histidine kinase [Belliella alkalica]